MKVTPTPQEFSDKMDKIIETFKDADPAGAIEDRHVIMDEYLCQTLEALGYGDGVRKFRTVYKWYA